jgi:hypothetical protein
MTYTILIIYRDQGTMFPIGILKKEELMRRIKRRRHQPGKYSQTPFHEEAWL